METSSCITNPVRVGAVAAALRMHKATLFRILKRRKITIQKMEWLTNGRVQLVSVISQADADSIFQHQREIARRSEWQWRPPAGSGRMSRAD